MKNNALYYPGIDLKNAALVKGLSMFYDGVYRIVPDGVVPEDDESLRGLLEQGVVGRMILPERYAKEASESFLNKISEWDAAALSGLGGESGTLSKIHPEKIDQSVRGLFKELGYKDDSEWLYVPTELASNYMLYLAQAISKKNSMDLVTDSWGPWTATNYFNLDGGVDELMSPYDPAVSDSDNAFQLYGLLVNGVTPINIGEISSDDIAMFRERRKDEIALFRKAVYELQESLQSVDDADVKSDLIADKISVLSIALAEYQRSADVVKAKGWFGVSFMGFPAPSILGNMLGLPDASTMALVATGVALGGLFNLCNTKQELKKLIKDNPASYLYDLRKDFQTYTSQRGGGAINYHAYNCMEEYVND